MLGCGKRKRHGRFAGGAPGTSVVASCALDERSRRCFERAPLALSELGLFEEVDLVRHAGTRLDEKPDHAPGFGILSELQASRLAPSAAITPRRGAGVVPGGFPRAHRVVIEGRPDRQSPERRLVQERQCVHEPLGVEKDFVSREPQAVEISTQRRTARLEFSGLCAIPSRSGELPIDGTWRIEVRDAAIREHVLHSSSVRDGDPKAEAAMRWISRRQVPLGCAAVRKRGALGSWNWGWVRVALRIERRVAGGGRSGRRRTDKRRGGCSAPSYGITRWGGLDALMRGLPSTGAHRSQCARDRSEANGRVHRASLATHQPNVSRAHRLIKTRSSRPHLVCVSKCR